MPVELENVSYTYAAGSSLAANAVNGVSLRIDDGEFVGLMGRTGCGKSTLIQLMSGLLTPDSGRVLINGEDINARGYDRGRLRRAVGVVFQHPEYQLFETTVERDVAFGLQYSGLNAQEKTERIRQALETVGFDFDKVRAKSPMGFSGGEKRRIAIAGVLAAKPGILILDEPIAGLDPLGRTAFLKMIDGLNRDGTTIIMISHNADALCEHAKRIIVLRDGRLAADGDTKTVFSDIEALRKNRIAPGQVRQTAELLRGRGVDIPADTVRYDELIAQLVRRCGRCGR